MVCSHQCLFVIHLLDYNTAVQLHGATNAWVAVNLKLKKFMLIPLAKCLVNGIARVFLCGGHFKEKPIIWYYGMIACHIGISLLIFSGGD
jgi:hypothetical protein